MENSGFLLPIGPLTYFENWYQKCKPNAGWIKRYSEIQADQTKATAEAETILANIREYIRRSARKVTITRAFIKYGARRIATMLAIAAMIILSGFYWYDAEQKQNDRVINEVRSEMMSLMKSKEVGTNIKAFPLLIEERYKPGSMMLYLNGLDIKARLSMGIATYEQLMGIDKHDTSNLKSELINLVQANFKESIAKETDHVFLVTELNKFATLYPTIIITTLIKPQKKCSVTWLMIFICRLRLFKTKSLFQATIPYELNYGLQQWLTFGRVTQEKVRTILALFSLLKMPEDRKF